MKELNDMNIFFLPNPMREGSDSQGKAEHPSFPIEPSRNTLLRTNQTNYSRQSYSARKMETKGRDMS